MNKIRICLLFSILPIFLFSQQHIGGKPYSFDSRLEEVPITTIPELDYAAIRKTDAQYPGRRFAAPVSIDAGLQNAGQWTTLPNGDRLWRLALRAPQALGLATFFDAFYLPKGATLYMYNADKTHWKGGYTSANNNESNRFWTGFTPGNTTILEYYEPAEVSGQGQLHIHRVDQIYDQEQYRSGEVAMMFGFGTADACNVNINCPEADAWQNEKQGVCRIIVVVAEGTGYCTGSLINNTEEDGTPYILSAFHCQDGFTPLWDMYRFDFNFESPDCDNPNQEPAYTSVLGSQLRAGRQENDFILLEIIEDLPANESFYFNGWNRETGVPDSTVLIHHARGDIQKFSKDHEQANIIPNSINWNNDVTTPPGHHLELILDVGTFEPGSSGGPFLNQDRQIVAQLHGGNPDCTDSEAWGGRLALSWDGGGSAATRLSDWLDPLGTGAMSQDGQFFPMGSNNISGKVHNAEVQGISNVKLYLYQNDQIIDSVTTAADGTYLFENLVLSNDYEIGLQKGGSADNGVSVIDLVRLQRHITTVELLPAPWGIIGANVSGDNSISVLDVVKIRRIILTIQDQFEDVPNWQFLPASFAFPNPANPIENILPTRFAVGDFTQDIVNLNFIGVKSGDVNGDAELN